MVVVVVVLKVLGEVLLAGYLVAVMFLSPIDVTKGGMAEAKG